MTSSTPSSTGAERSAGSLRRRPARWVAPVLMLLALWLAYSVYVRRPPSQAVQVPASRPAADPAAKEVAQLALAAEAAQTQLDQSTAQLASLRALAESAGDATSLEQTAAQARQELEQATATRQTHEEQLTLLQAARTDPARLAGAKITQLEARPALTRLRDALTAAESKTSQLLLTMLPDHPNVQACRAEEQQIRTQLQSELDAAIQEVQTEQTRLDTQADLMSEKLAVLQQRAQQLATVHADYNTLEALVQQQANDVRLAQDKLNHAEQMPSAEPIPDGSDTAVTPSVVPTTKGPGRALLLAAAIVGGLFVSLGLYTLRSSPVTPTCAPPASRPAVAPQTARMASAPAAPVSPISAIATPSPHERTGMSLTQALARCAELREQEC